MLKELTMGSYGINVIQVLVLSWSVVFVFGRKPDCHTMSRLTISPVIGTQMCSRVKESNHTRSRFFHRSAYSNLADSEMKKVNPSKLNWIFSIKYQNGKRH